MWDSLVTKHIRIEITTLPTPYATAGSLSTKSYCTQKHDKIHVQSSLHATGDIIWGSTSIHQSYFFSPWF